VSAVVVAVAVAGCSGVSQPVTGRVYDEFGCQLGCDRCAPQAQCISSPYKAACLAECTSAADCPPEARCTVLAGREMEPTVCVAPSSLGICHQPDCQIAPGCKDATTKMNPLPATFGVCGWELITCDSGCDSATGDCK
jgi:hypothetical protein